MPSTRSQGEPLTPYKLGEGVGLQPLRVIDVNNQALVENILGDAPRAQEPQEPQGPRLYENFRVNLNIADFDGPLVLPPLPQGHTFVVTSSLMQMLTMTGLFARLPADDPHAHIAKLNHEMLLYGSMNLDNSIYTWEQLIEALLARFFPVSKKLNKKDKLNNFVALPGESVRSSWDRFTAFMRGVPNHRIDDESLKEYFYRGQNDNGKAMLDTIAGGSYDECTFEQITEKMEKISRNNKASSTRKSDTGRITFVIQAPNNQPADEIREEMAQMRTELGLVLKHVTKGSEKIDLWTVPLFRQIIQRSVPVPDAEKIQVWRYGEELLTVDRLTVCTVESSIATEILQILKKEKLPKS
ncbi:hypothetical protein MTR67_007197 [Solanum verrucosum]|uniref:Retrotransposon gag domain-containing protein n=1 Tax=Solanum verrucosum TaxID=315347 RepID=A0AAF0PZD9_SOLVR|nr:hypothetical protein MTR67_007197 [Solanum verrucosum]